MTRYLLGNLAVSDWLHDIYWATWLFLIGPIRCLMETSCHGNTINKLRNCLFKDTVAVFITRRIVIIMLAGFPANILYL